MRLLGLVLLAYLGLLAIKQASEAKPDYVRINISEYGEILPAGDRSVVRSIGQYDMSSNETIDPILNSRNIMIFVENTSTAPARVEVLEIQTNGDDFSVSLNGDIRPPGERSLAIEANGSQQNILIYNRLIEGDRRGFWQNTPVEYRPLIIGNWIYSSIHSIGNVFAKGFLLLLSLIIIPFLLIAEFLYAIVFGFGELLVNAISPILKYIFYGVISVGMIVLIISKD